MARTKSQRTVQGDSTMSTSEDQQNNASVARLLPGSTGNLYTDNINSFKGPHTRPPLARKDHNIQISGSYHVDPALDYPSSSTFSTIALPPTHTAQTNTPYPTGPPFDLGFKTIRALPQVNGRSYTVQCGSRPFQGPFDQPGKRVLGQSHPSTYDFPLTPPDQVDTLGNHLGGHALQRHALLPPISLGLQDPNATHSRNSSLTSLFSSADSTSLPGICELSPLEPQLSEDHNARSRAPSTRPAQRDSTQAAPRIVGTSADLQHCADRESHQQGHSFVSKRRLTHISDPGSSTASRSPAFHHFYTTAPPLPDVAGPPFKARSDNMSVLAMRTDPLLSDGVVASPFPPKCDDQPIHGVQEHDLNGWLGSTQLYTGHGSIAGVSRESVSTSSLSSFSDEPTNALDDEQSKGQRVDLEAPLSGYNGSEENAGEGPNEMWSYDQAINALLSSAESMQGEQKGIQASCQQPIDQNQGLTTQGTSQIDYSPAIGPLGAKAMFVHTPQDEQQGMNYPSQISVNMERPLPTPSSAVPIGGEHLHNTQNQDQQQYLVPVVQRGEHLFYDPEYPITSAASYTFGANAHQNHSYVNGYQKRDGQGVGRQTSMNFGDQTGSRSAHENISQQNFVNQIPRSYHGYSHDQRTENAILNGPMSAFPGSTGQLPSALGSAFSHFSHENQNTNNLIIPTHHIQPSRSQDNLNAARTPSSAYPQTPSPQKRGGSAMSASFHHAQLLRSAAPEPEGPSAFMMAYQGGCTPQSVGQGRHPPSSASRFDEIKMELQDGYGETPEYEIERMRNIQANEQLMESLGLGSSPGVPSVRTSRSPSKLVKRKTSSLNVKANPGEKKSRFKNRVPSMGPVRSSTRLASMSRNVSYANLDSHNEDDSSEASFDSNDMDEREDSWDGSDSERTHGRRKKRNGGSRRQASGRWPQSQSRNNCYSYRNPTLRDLVDEHPDVRTVFPLFYNIITEDMIINNSTFPLIGSVPTSCNPIQKAGYLQEYYHKGRRAIAQLDAFTARCDKRYDGPCQRWTPLSAEMKIAIRDIRRKAVERCENYKYTRRDLLNKNLGKGKWAAIEDGWISWSVHSGSADPANDLEGIDLASPPPESDSGSQESMASSRRRALSRKRSQAFGRKASRGDMNRNSSLRLHTNDVFQNGYSDERSHAGVGFPSVPMKQNIGDGMYTPVTPQRQQSARFNPMYTQTPNQYTFSPGSIQDTPLNVVTPSIIRAARFASNNPLGSPFGTPASAGGFHIQQGTPTHHLHHANPQQLFVNTPVGEQETTNSIASHPMSMDEGMLTGGVEMSYNMSEVTIQPGGEVTQAFNEQTFTNGI